jgi:hypothetical protein
MAKAWQEVEAEGPLKVFDTWPAGDGRPATERQAALQPKAVPTAKPIDWRKRMSDTIAYALLVYTALQIFVTMGALKTEGGSLLPYLALVILVAAIIPSCRRFERRWNRLGETQAADPALAPWFHRDQFIVWTLAIGLPFAITGVFRLLGAIFPQIAH